MKEEEIKKVTDKVGKKKAKLKTIKTEPEGTKSKKLEKQLKVGLENLSGMNLDNVRVHYGGNSAEICKELGAKAFTQGSDIYIAKSSDASNNKFVAHEAWHVIQQASGRKLSNAQKGKALVSK